MIVRLETICGCHRTMDVPKFYLGFEYVVVTKTPDLELRRSANMNDAYFISNEKALALHPPLGSGQRRFRFLRNETVAVYVEDLP